MARVKIVGQLVLIRDQQRHLRLTKCSLSTGSTLPLPTPILSKSVIYIWASARFRAVQNWAIGNDRFQLFSFLGSFLQMLTEVIMVNSVNQKICPQFAVRRKDTLTVVIC